MAAALFFILTGMVLFLGFCTIYYVKKHNKDKKL